jgi:hypothetical protein
MTSSPMADERQRPHLKPHLRPRIQSHCRPLQRLDTRSADVSMHFATEDIAYQCERHQIDPDGTMHTVYHISGNEPIVDLFGILALAQSVVIDVDAYMLLRQCTRLDAHAKASLKEKAILVGPHGMSF